MRRTDVMRATEQGARAWSAVRSVAVLALVLTLCGVVLARQRAHAAAPAETRKSEDIVRGTVVSASPAAIEVRDAKGALHRVAVSATTLVLSDAEDFSVANLPNIELAVSDLSAGDRVEVVVEPDQSRSVAGIVTKISPIDATATAKADPRR